MVGICHRHDSRSEETNSYKELETLPVKNCILLNNIPAHFVQELNNFAQLLD